MVETGMTMLRSKSFRIFIILAAAGAIAFGLPIPKYKSTDVLDTLNVPMSFGEWTGRDFETGQKLMDEKYNFINALFLREYKNPQGREIYLYLLDAGNFHNPRVCLTGAGFKTRDLEDVAFKFKPSSRVKDQAFNGNSIYINKGNEGALVTYWMIINGHKVSWIQQRTIELWYSLIGKRKAGLMVRMDTPTNDADLPYAREAVQSFLFALEEAVTPNDRWFIFGR